MIYTLFNNKKFKNKILINGQQYLKRFIYKFLESSLIYHKLLPLIPSQSARMLKFFIFLTKIKNLYFMHILLISFECIPRINLLIVLYIDILIVCKFNYFYKYLWVILLPLLFNVFWFILNDYATNVIKEMSTLVKIETEEITVQNHLLLAAKTKYTIIQDSEYTENSDDMKTFDLVYRVNLQILLMYEFLSELKARRWFKIFLILNSCAYIYIWGSLILRIFSFA
jgi:hypothetical protein